MFMNGRNYDRFMLSLIQTCRQIRAEGMPFFSRGNNFILSNADICYRLKEVMPVNKIKEATFNWQGYAQDAISLSSIAKWPQLKVLHIILNKQQVRVNKNVTQTLYQGESTLQKFNKRNGFDKLVQIQGLELVTVDSDENPMPGSWFGDADMEALQGFEPALDPAPLERIVFHDPGPLVVVISGANCEDAEVDGAGTTQAFSPGIIQLTIAAASLWGCFITPAHVLILLHVRAY